MQWPRPWSWKGYRKIDKIESDGYIVSNPSKGKECWFALNN